MTTLLAPTPGTTVPASAVAATAPADGAAERVVERALPAAIVLRIAVVVAGLVVAAAGEAPFTAGTAVAAGVLAGDAGWRLLGSSRARAGTSAVALVAAVIAVAMSGGWSSPFGAVLAVDLAIVGLARGYRHAFTVAAGVAAACLVGGALAGAALTPADGATPLPLLLLLGAALGGYAHGLAAGEHHPQLGHSVHLADAHRLVTDLHDTLRSLPTAPDTVTVVRTALGWLAREVPFTAAALVVGDGEDSAHVVHAEGVEVTGAEAAALVAFAPATAAVGPAGQVRLTDAGVATGWLPLALRGREVGLLVIEAEQPLPAQTGELLAALGGPLSLALDTARWFARLSTLAGELERSRLAGDLADRLCQSMATTVFALDLAAIHSGDRELVHIADAVRNDVTDLRRTLDDLRASISADSDVATIVGGCLERAGERAGFVTLLEVDASSRPSTVVEQQVLRVLQELLAALERATAVTVRWRSDHDALELSLRHDGDLEVPPSVADRADAIGAVLSSSAVPGGAVLTVTTEVPA